MENRAEVTELQPAIFQIRGLNGSSHSYVIKGNYKNVMIDSGSDQNFPVLERGLFQIGLKVRDIDLVINSHEHCDHISANRYFHESAMIAAYRLAASKMISGDYYVTMYKANDLKRNPDAGALVARKYDPHRSRQLQPANFSHSGPHVGVHLDRRNHSGLTFFSRQRVCWRHSVIHRRIGEHRRLYRLFDETTLFWLAGSLPGSWSHFNDAHRKYRFCNSQCSKAFRKFDQKRPGDFLSKG
jgi:hypothetical protein